MKEEAHFIWFEVFDTHFTYFAIKFKDDTYLGDIEIGHIRYIERSEQESYDLHA